MSAPSRRAKLLAWVTVCVVIALTALVIAPAALKIPFDFTVNKLFVQDGRDQEVLQRVKERFTESDGDAIVMLSLDEASWFEPARLDALRALHERIQELSFEPGDLPLKRSEGCDDPGENPDGAYDRVESLYTADVFRRRGQSVQIEPLYSEEGFGPAEQTKRELLGHPLLKGRLISEDGRATLILARVHCDLRADAVRSRYLQALRDQIDAWIQDHPDVTVQTTGMPYIQNDIIRTMRDEVWSRQPLVGLGMVVFLWLAFRRFRYAVLPFLSVALASLWWLGLMQLTGGSINVINFSTVTVILVIGIGDAIHLVARVEEGLDAQQSPFEALVTGWRAMLPAITLTTTTTVIGFASLSVARVELVRAYGQSAALGIALCWLFTLSVVPALLLIAPPQSKVRHSNERLWLNRVALPAVSVFVRARPGLISACSVAIFVISLVFASQLEPFSRALEEVQEDHPAQVALSDLERQFTGAMPFDIVLEGPRNELLKPSNLRRIAALQERLDASPAGIKSLSIVDLLGSLHGLWAHEQPGSRETLPERPDQIDALLSLMTLDDDTMTKPFVDDPEAERAPVAAAAHPGDALDDEMVIEGDEDDLGIEEDAPAQEPPTQAMLSPNRAIGLRISALKKDTGSSLFARDIEWVETTLAQWPGDITGTLTGGSKLANRAVQSVVVDMMSSLLLAFGLIGLMFIAVLRSWRQGLVAMLPNILPLVVTMGVMTVTGMSLRISTVIIFAMCMGVVVDDTIHFLVRFRQERATQDFDPALHATILHAGRPVVFTTMMLAMGFALLIPSEFNGLKDFGWLSAICIGLALFADLLTLPAVLALNERWRTSRRRS